MAKTSNFIASLTPANFEGVISRHGQYVRWIRRHKCYCLTKNGNPDPRHKGCNGRGWISDLQTTMIVEGEVAKHNGTIIIPAFSIVTKVLRIYRDDVDYNLDDIAIVVDKCGKSCLKWIGTSGEGWDSLSPHQTVKIDYEYSLETETNWDDISYLGKGLLRLNNFTFDRKYNNEIINVVSVVNNTEHLDIDPPNDPLPITRTVIGFSGRYIYFEDDGQELDSDDWHVTITYSKPHIFGLLGITQNMRMEDAWVQEEGDALVVVPYNIEIGEGDLVTTLLPETRSNQQFELNIGQDDYEFNQFEVSKILNIADDSAVEYIEGVDYIITSRNILRFLTGGKKPVGKFSALFMYNPTFIVLGNIPNLRTPENKKFPRKVSVKLYSPINRKHNKTLGRRYQRS